MSANENSLKKQLEGLLKKPCWFKEGTLEIRHNSDAFLSEVNEDHIVLYNSIFDKKHRILFSQIVSIERKDLVKKENLSLSTPNSTPYSSSSKSGCFIATAVYGSPYANEVSILKEFRDNWLLNFRLGKIFVNFYYWASPPIANQIAKREYLKNIIKVAFIIPLIKIVNNLKVRRNNYVSNSKS
jgi:hypothetical protein